MATNKVTVLDQNGVSHEVAESEVKDLLLQGYTRANGVNEELAHVQSPEHLGDETSRKLYEAPLNDVTADLTAYVPGETSKADAGNESDKPGEKSNGENTGRESGRVAAAESTDSADETVEAPKAAAKSTKTVDGEGEQKVANPDQTTSGK